MSMSGGGGPRPMLPGLSAMYVQGEPWAYLLLRVVAGAMLIAHGWPKLMAGPAAVAAGAMTRRGIEPAYAVACIAIFLELVGAACIILGLLTRPFALLVIIEFVIITYSHLTMGGWGVGGGGAEFAFLWLIVFVYILVRGGGPYSVDAKLGKEF
jgi:putative oxidoreductase